MYKLRARCSTAVGIRNLLCGRLHIVGSLSGSSGLRKRERSVVWVSQNGRFDAYFTNDFKTTTPSAVFLVRYQSERTETPHRLQYVGNIQTRFRNRGYVGTYQEFTARLNMVHDCEGFQTTTLKWCSDRKSRLSVRKAEPEYQRSTWSWHEWH